MDGGGRLLMQLAAAFSGELAVGNDDILLRCPLTSWSARRTKRGVPWDEPHIGVDGALPKLLLARRIISAFGRHAKVS